MIITQTNNNLKKKIACLEKQIGNTPLFRISNLSPNPAVKIYAKLEWQQFGGSVKSRPAFNIIKQAIYSGALHPDKTLIDASSGNTAIAYATIAAALGIKVKLFIPANASDERKQILKRLGAEISLTSPLESTDGAQAAANAAYKDRPDLYFYADQYGNANNWKAHYYSTAPEIIQQTGGGLTHFVAGLGTTGTFTGVATRLQEELPNVQTIALQPDSPMHGLEGWKHLETALVPKIYNPNLAHIINTVSTEKALLLVKNAARMEGLLISPSAAANLTGALDLAAQIDRGTIVTIFADDASKYGEVMNHIF